MTARDRVRDGDDCKIVTAQGLRSFPFTLGDATVDARVSRDATPLFLSKFGIPTDSLYHNNIVKQILDLLLVHLHLVVLFNHHKTR